MHDSIYLRWYYTSWFLTHIFNLSYTSQLLTQLCCGNGMLHETIFNATWKIRETMLQVFESLSKTCNMLPQRDITFEVALRAMLHFTDF